MKILQIGKYYPPYRGGMETVLENLVEGLLDADIDVHTLVSGLDTHDRTSVIKGPSSGNEGQLIRVSRAGQLSSQPLNTTLLSQLRKQLDTFQPDLVHLHLPNPLAVLAWSVLARWYGRNMPPLAVWYHADITRQRLGAKLLRPLIQSTLKQSAGICVSTESLAQNSSCLGGLAGKIQVIPFGISPEPWINIDPLQGGSFLFVGRLVPYKGLEILLDALQKVPGSTLDVVGQGPLENLLERKIQQENLADRVRLHGSCTADQLAVLMAQARALVLPSLDQSETFGLVQLEAMASGIPVIASALKSGVAEVGVEGETCLLVPPGDVVSLSLALQKIQTDNTLALNLGRASRQRFHQFYSREIMIDNILTWYRRLLNPGLPKGNL